jgi:hypothetical protein
MPSSARDIIHSKEKMVEELKGLKETHLRNQAFYDQLLGLMLQSPDTDEEVTPTLPPIHLKWCCRVIIENGVVM